MTLALLTAYLIFVLGYVDRYLIHEDHDFYLFIFCLSDH